MATPSPPQIRSLYRRLLRELPSTPSTSTSSPRTLATAHAKLSTPSTLQRRIRTSLASPPTTSSPTTTTTATSRLAQAEQFIKYIQAQRMYATLIERYNPGMGMSEEERVRLSARRVGVDLPREFRKE